MVIEGTAAALSLIGLFGICLQNDWMLITDSGITCCIIIPITVQMCFAFFLSKSHEVERCQETDYGVTKLTFQALQIMPFAQLCSAAFGALYIVCAIFCCKQSIADDNESDVAVMTTNDIEQLLKRKSMGRLKTIQS